MSIQKQTAKRCRICKSELIYKWSLNVLLERHQADYFECQQCHTLQIPNPFWLEEAYALEEEIALSLNPDEGRFRRNFSAYHYFTALQKAGVFSENPKILDFGGGYGLLTQMLLDGGFDAWHTDFYINKPLFAPHRYIKDIETLPAASFDVILALEVFEHLTEPFEVGKQLQRLLKPTGTLIISTSIYDPTLHTVEWHYLGKEQGQHVTFWTQSALQYYAKFLDFESIYYFPAPPGEFFILFSSALKQALEKKISQATQYLNDPNHLSEITIKWDISKLLGIEKEILKKVKEIEDSNNVANSKQRILINRSIDTMPNVLYDISVLGLGHHNVQAKTGVFRMTEQLAEGLLKSPLKDNLAFCATGFPNAFPVSKGYQFTNPKLQHIPLYHLENLPEANIFHSTFWALPDKITKLHRFLTVSDLVPVKFPDLFVDNESGVQQEIFKALRPNDWIICISHSTKNDFCEYTHFDPNRVFVTHLAADPTLFYPCTDPETLRKVHIKYGIPDAPYLLTVATLEPRKNIAHVIRSFVELVQAEKLADLNLVLVGTKGWKFEEIFTEIAQQTTLKERIILTGFVANEDLAPLYSGALAFVYPSLYEGFGLPPLEAMQCGIPVITSNISSLPEVVGDAGILLDPTDQDSLCQQFLKIYQNTSLRNTLSLQSLERAKQFSWEKCVQETIDAYQTAFNETSPNPSSVRRGERVVSTVIIDGVFYQRFNTGIARVWNSLFAEWIKDGFAKHILVLDRAGTAPRISGIRYRTVLPHDYDSLDFDRQMLQQICDEEGAKVFISTYYTIPLRTPTVFLAYDMIPEVIGTGLNHPMWQEKHDSINHAVAHLAISENTARDLHKFFPQISLEKVTIAYSGLDNYFKPANAEEMTRFKAKYNLSKPYFLLVGSRGAYKNTLLFFKAFQQFPANQDFAIVCTGGMPFSAEEQPYIQNQTVYNLELDDEALRCAYSGAVALVYPSKYEGFGLPILEAMACGCPVITCRNSAIPEVAGDAAFYVAEDDVAELIQALTAIQLTETREPLIAKGFERVQLFSWEKMAKTVKSVLTDVAGKNIAETPTFLDFSYALEWKKRKNLSLIIKQPPIIQMVQTGRTEEAIQRLNQQINIEPAQAFAYNDLGVLLFPMTDKQQQAVKYVEQALSLNPIDVGILKNLAKVYSFIGKDEEAFNILASLFDNQPNDAEIVLEMAEICTFLKREELAKQFWDKVKQLPKSMPSPQKSPPTQAQPEITLSVTQQTTLQAVQAGQAQAVVAKLMNLLDTEDNALNRNDLAVLLFSNEQTRAQALEHLKIALNRQPNHVTIVRNLARVYTFLKRHDEAKPLWEHLLRLKPNDAEAEEALAQFITIALPTSSSPKKKSKAKKRKKKRG